VWYSGVTMDSNDDVSQPRGPEPVTIDVDRDHGVTIEWQDDHGSRFDLDELRINCQCAECRGLRQRGMAVWPRPGAPSPLRIESADLVGAYGIHFVWNDGHRTGIYPWEILRAWCHCPRCAPGGG
jgi:DUF971 family protein